MRRKTKRYLLIVFIFSIAIAAWLGLSMMKPPPEKKETVKVDLLVDVMPLTIETVSLTVASQGTVRPRTETILSAEVSGSIVSISRKFVPGGVFGKNEVLMRIDPTNYIVAVDQAEALLEQRQIEYDGAAKLRRQGYRAESEYASAAAALASAKAELVRARRNLERTYIRLPYDGMVRTKETELGQYVNVGSRVGVVFATDEAEIRLPLTDSDLAFVDLPDAGEMSETGAVYGPKVTLTAVQKGQTMVWYGRIVRSEGVVDEKTRVTYAVVRIEDPYQMSAAASAAPPLPMGTFVAATIEGKSMQNVLRIPRSALRGNGQVIVVDDNSLVQIRSVDILRADADYAYLLGGAVEGERLCLTAIENPINGMRVRTSDEHDDRAITASGVDG
ncbi:MAG: efflux RND transporter periplasmic adaptor subunit [Gammaproteobacteria bacterium]|nr:efflux RND transporter periplasmic adaptor subunit [Gammaproteobacteria bacterium]